jgi:hypothetical protein
LGIEEYIKLFVRDIFCFELTVECPQTTVWDPSFMLLALRPSEPIVHDN